MIIVMLVTINNGSSDGYPYSSIKMITESEIYVIHRTFPDKTMKYFINI